MQITTIGLDIAKNVFQVHGIDAAEKVVVRKQVRRSQVLGFFEALPPCLIGMEACATAHYWARELVRLGHQVRLMPAKDVNTVNLALEILDRDFLKANYSDRKALKLRFDELSKAGDVRFVTFHQSFSYEDFVEGLQAETDDDGNIRYVVREGVFKGLCNVAAARVTQKIDAAIDIGSPHLEDVTRKYTRQRCIHLR